MVANVSNLAMIVSLFSDMPKYLCSLSVYKTFLIISTSTFAMLSVYK